MPPPPPAPFQALSPRKFWVSQPAMLLFPLLSISPSAPLWKLFVRPFQISQKGDLWPNPYKCYPEQPPIPTATGQCGGSVQVGLGDLSPSSAQRTMVQHLQHRLHLTIY